MINNVLDLTNFSALLNDEERMLQTAMREFADKSLRPNIQDWYENSSLPVEHLSPQFGELGALGMHLEGYDCPGTSAVAYGLACMEIEAVDSGLRSFVSVQGSLAMFAIHHWGSEEQKQKYLPKMAAGEYIGCFGLTEPDAGSDPASMKTRAVRDGDDWILNGTKMWITNSPIADVAVVWARTDEGFAGFILEKGMEGFSAPEIHKKLSLRASITGEIVLDNCRVSDAQRLPEVSTLRGPLTCLNEARYGIIWGARGAARDSLETAIEYTETRNVFGKTNSS